MDWALATERSARLTAEGAAEAAARATETERIARLGAEAVAEAERNARLASAD